MTKPVLQLARDGAPHRTADAAEIVADHLRLSDEDRRETISSGGRRYVNRTSWAVSHLLKAELLEKPKRGWFRITDAGQEAVLQAPAIIDEDYLAQHFPAWVTNWASASTRNRKVNLPAVKPAGDEVINRESPEERIEAAHDEIRSALRNEILTTIKDMSPSFFEKLVIRMIVTMGYGGTLRDAGQALGKSGDGGVDGIIKEDRLGLDTIYLQAKRYSEGSVGRPDVQAFVGALQGVRAKKGIFITTTTFAQTAHDYVKNIETKVVLIDGQQLADYMIDFGVGVTTVNTFDVKRLDSDFFVDD